MAKRKSKSKSTGRSPTKSKPAKSAKGQSKRGKKKSSQPRPVDDARREKNRRRVVRSVSMLVVIALAGGAGWAMRRLEKRILAGENGQAAPRYRIVLTHLPSTVPPMLARRIRRELRPEEVSFFASELTRLVHQRAAGHPWIRHVQRVRKRRTDDPNLAVVEVQASYRRPAAVVRYQGEFHFVDAHGVVLRDGATYQSDAGLVQYREVPRYRLELDGGRVGYAANADQVPPSARKQRIHYVAIDGVASSPPEPGKTWDAADLRAALRLVKLFSAKPYGREITWVDVTNFGWRATPHSKKEPQLKLFAQLGRRKATEIRWGQFPRKGGDWIVSPGRKMGNLDEWVAARGGRLSGWKDWIDLRYDHILTSRE